MHTEPHHIPEPRARIFVMVITHNSEKYIEHCLDSLAHQTYTNFTTIIIDTASQDGTREVLRAFPHIPVIHNVTNIGFGRALNQGFALALENNSLTRPDFILFLNPDTILSKTAIASLIAAADAHSEYDAFGPKLLRFHFAPAEDETMKPVLTTTVDSAGLAHRTSYQFYSIGEGEEDRGQYAEEKEVWGFSGTALLVRSTALKTLKIKTGEYFDEDFFMYKEDIDFCSRMHAIGARFLFVPSACIHHYRTVRGAMNDLTTLNFFNNLSVARRGKSVDNRFFGYRNQLFFLYKNLSAKTFFAHCIPILWFEFRITVYYCFTRPTLVFRAWIELLQRCKQLRTKRSLIQNI